MDLHYVDPPESPDWPPNIVLREWFRVIHTVGAQYTQDDVDTGRVAGDGLGPR